MSVREEAGGGGTGGGGSKEFAASRKPASFWHEYPTSYPMTSERAETLKMAHRGACKFQAGRRRGQDYSVRHASRRKTSDRGLRRGSSVVISSKKEMIQFVWIRFARTGASDECGGRITMRVRVRKAELQEKP